MNDKPKILFFIGVDWFFYSHFLDRALAAKAAGYEVVVVTGVTRSNDPLATHGIKLIGIPLKRRSLNPLGLLQNLRQLIGVLKQEQPAIVHLIAIKPIIIGSIACRVVGINRIVNAVVGLGFAFTSDRIAARVMRTVLSGLFRLVLNHKNTKTVFENKDDLNDFVNKGWVKQENAVLIRGAGVDTAYFKPETSAVGLVGVADGAKTLVPQDTITAQPMAEPVVMLLSRMLWDKGVGEFVAAARLLKSSSDTKHMTFVLVGDPDEDNRGTIGRDQLLAWQDEGVVQWWGYHENVREVLKRATVSCLPSYREGLPKSLLESLAMGLPCIATDVPGCREAVVDGVNGFLVSAKDSISLAQVIKRLIDSPELVERFGQASRQMAVDQFSKEIVNEQTLALYRDLMSPPSPQSTQPPQPPQPPTSPETLQPPQPPQPPITP